MQARTLTQALLLTNSQFNVDELELNHEALALLLKHGWRVEKNKRQTYLAAGSEDLRALLPRLKLDQGSEAFILVRPFIHSMAVYARNDNGFLRFFVFDSQAWGLRYYPTRLILQAIHDHFPYASTYLSMTEFQPQHIQRGCSEYTLTCLAYMVDHGTDFFEKVTKFECKAIESYDNAFFLAEDALPKEWKIAVAEQHAVYLKKVDDILQGYSKENDIDHTKIHSVIREMQGLDEEPVDLHYPPLYVTQISPGCVTLHLSKEQKRYANFVFYSQNIYPGSVVLNRCTSLVEGVKDIKLSFEDNDTSSVTIAANNTGELEKLVSVLPSQAEALYHQHMRQQLALQALSETIEEAIELEKIWNNSHGGMDQYQVQSALKYMLQSHPEVYVPSYKELLGLGAKLSLAKLQKNGYQRIAFSFSIDNKHQVAVLIDLNGSIYSGYIYDSLGEKLKSDDKDRLLKLFDLDKFIQFTDMLPFYKIQRDNFSCGFHVIANLEAACKEETTKKQELNVAKLARYYLRASNCQRKKENAALLEEENADRVKRHLLHIIECYRDEQGFFSLKERVEADRLRTLADYLQNILWGNERSDHLDNEGRINNSNESERGKSLIVTLQEYKEVYSDNVGEILLGMACLFDKMEREKRENYIVKAITLLLREKQHQLSKPNENRLYRNLYFPIETEMDLVINSQRTSTIDKLDFIREALIILLSNKESRAIFADFFDHLGCDNYVDYYNGESVDYNEVFVFILKTLTKRIADLENSISSEIARKEKERIERETALAAKTDEIKILLSQCQVSIVDDSIYAKLAANVSAYQFLKRYGTVHTFAHIHPEYREAVLLRLSVTQRNFDLKEAIQFITEPNISQFLLHYVPVNHVDELIEAFDVVPVQYRYQLLSAHQHIIKTIYDLVKLRLVLEILPDSDRSQFIATVKLECNDDFERYLHNQISQFGLRKIELKGDLSFPELINIKTRVEGIDGAEKAGLMDAFLMFVNTAGITIAINSLNDLFDLLPLIYMSRKMEIIKDNLHLFASHRDVKQALIYMDTVDHSHFMQLFKEIITSVDVLCDILSSVQPYNRLAIIRQYVRLIKNEEDSEAVRDCLSGADKLKFEELVFIPGISSVFIDSKPHPGLRYLTDKERLDILQQYSLQPGQSLTKIIWFFPERDRPAIIRKSLSLVKDELEWVNLMLTIKKSERDKQLPSFIYLEQPSPTINDINTLLTVLNYVEPKDCFYLLNRYEACIENGIHLSRALWFIPSEKRLKAAAHFVDRIQDEYEWAYVMMSLKKNERELLPFVCPEQPSPAIKNVCMLMLPLQYLEPASRFSFLKRYEDRIKNGYQLELILWKIPSEERLAVAKYFINHIKTEDEWIKVVSVLKPLERPVFPGLTNSNHSVTDTLRWSGLFPLSITSEMPQPAPMDIATLKL